MLLLLSFVLNRTVFYCCFCFSFFVFRTCTRGSGSWSTGSSDRCESRWKDRSMTRPSSWSTAWRRCCTWRSTRRWGTQLGIRREAWRRRWSCLGSFAARSCGSELRRNCKKWCTIRSWERPGRRKRWWRRRRERRRWTSSWCLGFL